MKKIFIMVLLLSYALAYGEVPKENNQSEIFEETEFEYIKEIKKRKEPVSSSTTVKLIVQPIIAACFTAPWVVYVSKRSIYDQFLLGKHKNLEIGLLVATPFAMSISIGLAGWLLDNRSYHLLPTLGITLGFSFAGALIGAIIIPLLMIIGSLGIFFANPKIDKDTGFIIIASAHLFSIIGTVGGSFFSVFIARKKRIPVQGALINGTGQDISFAFPLPSVGMKQDGLKKIETVFNLELVHYNF